MACEEIKRGDVLRQFELTLKQVKRLYFWDNLETTNGNIEFFLNSDHQMRYLPKFALNLQQSCYIKVKNPTRDFKDLWCIVTQQTKLRQHVKDRPV